MGGATLFFIAGFLLIGAFAAVFFLGKPMWLIVIGLLWYGFAFLSTNTYFPVAHARLGVVVSYADELLLIPLFIALIMRVVSRKEISAQRILNLWILLVATTLISGVLNGSGLKMTLSYEQAYYRHFVLFFTGSIFFNPTPRNFRRITYAFVVFLFIQIAFDILWFVDIEPFKNRFSSTSFDWAVGTMGLTSTVCYIAIIGVTFGISAVVSEKRLKSRLNYIIITTVSLILLAIGHTKHSIILAAASVAVGAFMVSQRHIVRRILLVVLAVGIIVGLSQFYNLSFKGKRYSWYSKVALSQSANTKKQVHEDVVSVLTKNNTWFIGEGPGRFSSVVAYWNYSPLFLRYFYAELEQARYNPHSSIMLYPRTGILSLLGDTGILGLGLYLVLCISVFWRIFSQVRKGLYDTSFFAKIMAICWCGWSVSFLFLNILADVLNFGPLPFLTWAWAGILWRPPVLQETDDESNDSMIGSFDVMNETDMFQHSK